MLSGLTIALLAACSADAPTVPEVESIAVSAATVSTGRVGDLSAVAVTDSSVELRWTQVTDGTGRPALYRLKYSEPTFTWASAAVGCNAKGSAIGSSVTCTVAGLEAGTAYDFQLMSYRLENNQWQGAVYSNVARGTTSYGKPGDVTDLALSSATSTTLTVSWTQVSDGTGVPAKYRVKYATPTIDYGTAAVGCRTVDGTAVGTGISCTIEGLQAGTTYAVQLMAYRADASGAWLDSKASNVLTAATSAPVAQAPRGGIWTSAAELARRPTSGADWEQLLRDASRDPGRADIGDQDSQHDVFTLAAALVCVRTGQYCDKARKGVLDAMYTEEDPSDADGDPIPMARWMAVGRNLTAYVIAADLLDLRRGGSAGADGDRVHRWIEGFLTKRLVDNNDRNGTRVMQPFHSSANGAAQEGLAYAAVAAYLRNQTALDFVWEGFRTFVCDAGAVNVMNIYMTPPVRDGWTHDSVRPCAVNPKGTTKRVPSGRPGAGSTRRIDGALVGDMRRGGVYQWVPGYTSYPWVGLEGLIPAAVILERAGYPALSAADQAVLRTHDYLWYLRNDTGDTRWFDGVRAREIVHLVNVMYGKSFPVSRTIGAGRTVGYTGWTHATR